MAGFTLADERETPRAAEDLGARAMQLRDGNGRIADPLVWSWRKEMSLHHWHCWGSQATGGGEGADIVRHIDAAKKAFEQAEQVSARVADFREPGRSRGARVSASNDRPSRD